MEAALLSLDRAVESVDQEGFMEIKLYKLLDDAARYFIITSATRQSSSDPVDKFRDMDDAETSGCSLSRSAIDAFQDERYMLTGRDMTEMVHLNRRTSPGRNCPHCS
jgi:hypothetical protein